MKIKLESSKYDFKTKEEETNFKLKIKKSLEIDIEKFEFNAGLRSISKHALTASGVNSDKGPQTKYATEVSEFYEILLDDKLDNLSIQFINDDMVQMTYNFKDQFVDNSKNKNIYTSHVLPHATLQSVSWILAEFYFNRGLQRLYTGTCIILQKTINGFLCLLIVFLKSKTYQLILKDVIKLNRNLP